MQTVNQIEASGEKSLDRVSIIITCYNQAHYLSESIDSVLSQAYPNLEVTVIDDGSQDRPEKILAKYRGIKFIRQNNQGASAARNRGAYESHGDLLVFLDADDRLLSRAIPIGVELFRQNPNWGFVFGKGILIDGAGRPHPRRCQPPSEGVGYLQLLQRNPIPFPALVMHNRTAFEAVGGFKSFIGKHFIGNTADYELYLRIANSYPIHFHGVEIAEWRQHMSNTSRNSLMMLRSCVHVLKAQRELTRGNPEFEKALEVGIKRVRSYYGEQLIDELRAEKSVHKLTWTKLGSSVSALLWHYPEGLTDNLSRKFRQVVQRMD